MIAYFDTSALIPLVITEPSSETCAQLWDSASARISTRLIYPEARAGIAQARRIGRLTDASLSQATHKLLALSRKVIYLEITAEIARSAGDLAQDHGLRGYDAVHLASAASAIDDDLTFVTGDRGLAAAARSIGIAVAFTSA